MKKIILLALCWPFCYYPLYAQKEKIKDEKREIIIIRKGDKEQKFTIETKDGEVFINGKPSSEYKDDDVSIIRRKFTDGQTFYTPGTKLFETWGGGNKPVLGVITEKADDGVKITRVSKGSAAEKAGLKEGDIITKLGNNKISDPEDLMDAVATQKVKDNVNVTYKRDGKTGEAKATLGERNAFTTFEFSADAYNKSFSKGFNFLPPLVPLMPNQNLSMTWGLGRGRLGVTIEDTDNDSGAKITDVNDDTPAAKAGLKENDIITEVNSKKVKDVNEVRKEIANAKDKNSYNIKAKRSGSEMNFEVKIPKKVNKATL
jgi:serine protease Do